MFETKEILAALGILLVVVAYALYFRDIFYRSTKPHAFSWFIWILSLGIGYAAQVAGNAGPGSWVLLIEAVACGCVFVIALVRGEKGYAVSDWIALILSFLALLLWGITGTPLLSVILIAIVDVFAFCPTYRKSFHKPLEESMSMYVLSSVKFVFVLLALENYSMITALYPAFLVLLNAGLPVMLWWRRKPLS